MYMRTFLIMFRNILKKDYPDIEIEFYLSRRSKFVHMRLQVQLNKIADSEKFIKKIEDFWLNKNQDDKFHFVNPYLIASTKWKFDYIIFEKNFHLSK